jgi:hypothetical protein
MTTFSQSMGTTSTARAPYKKVQLRAALTPSWLS